MLSLALLAAAAPQAGSNATDPATFVHWESPHVHPLELSADGATLLAVNTPDARLLVLDASGDEPVVTDAIPVGLDPVSVRLRTPGEAWVVNHVSDTVSVVDLATGGVRATLRTADEPCDVVFAGTPERAFVSCSQENILQVFDPADLSAPPQTVALEAEDPRALAVSPDGSTVYAAVFESGNGSTILGGGLDTSVLGSSAFPPNVVNRPATPYGGQNPPPNAGSTFEPPLNGNNPTPPPVGLIVKQDDNGRWMDDNGGDWTLWTSGNRAARSGRPVGWTLLDRDLAVVDASTLAVTYVPRLMNLNMALAVRPSDGVVAVVGTDATNEVRFEPNLTGTFTRSHVALVDPSGGAAPSVVDLNPQLDYSTGTVPQATRDLGLGDPRAVVWTADGSTAWVAGMGSDNVVSLDAAGARSGAPVDVGGGPTGLALDEARGRLYVLDKFDAAVSVVDVAARAEVARAAFFDPSPAAIRAGRPFLYDTHRTSGTGIVACASCHVDSRIDRLSWDLGNPAGDMADFDQNCLDGACTDFHPMKGPMLTQTLQDIVGKEPHHWRGDRTGLEEFNDAFVGLLGDDVHLTDAEMQAFEDFLATIHFPPNPFRNVDNTLPDDLDLTGHFATGRFVAAGTPLPNGDATRGLSLFLPPNLPDGQTCVSCHTLPTGVGIDGFFNGNTFVPIAAGPDGERHHAVVGLDGSTQRHFKVPQLRNLYDRVGFEATRLESRAGFGYLHDGSVDSIARFVSEPVFQIGGVQDVADLTAFLLAFSGSDLPDGDPQTPMFPPGTASNDTHAAVGVQVTLVDAATAPPDDVALVDRLVALAGAGAIDLVARGRDAGEARGWVLDGSTFASDRRGETATRAALEGLAAAGSELTYTAVPAGEGVRLGVDRDGDGVRDGDERDLGTDPADADDRPAGLLVCAPNAPNSTGEAGLLLALGSDELAADSLRLAGSQLPDGASCVALVSRDQGFTAMPGGSAGDLCLDGDIGRFAARAAAGGTVEFPVDAAALPQPGGPVGAQVGDTWTFQVWYRDGGGSNFTNAVEVTFR